MLEYRTRRRIEFSDTDAGGIAHFSRFFVFMEIAEHEMLRGLGVDPGAGVEADGRLIGWPRVSAACDFLSPIRFGDEIDILVQVLKVGTSSVTLGFTLSHGDTPVARGRSTAVRAWLDAPGGIQAQPLPAPLRELLLASTSDATPA